MNPLLGRWISADPLAVHAPGEADLNVYAYVSGAVLKATDPLGLKMATGFSVAGDSASGTPDRRDEVTTAIQEGTQDQIGYRDVEKKDRGVVIGVSREFYIEKKVDCSAVKCTAGTHLMRALIGDPRLVRIDNEALKGAEPGLHQGTIFAPRSHDPNQIAMIPGSKVTVDIEKLVQGSLYTLGEGKNGTTQWVKDTVFRTLMHELVHAYRSWYGSDQRTRKNTTLEEARLPDGRIARSDSKLEEVETVGTQPYSFEPSRMKRMPDGSTKRVPMRKITENMILRDKGLIQRAMYGAHKFDGKIYVDGVECASGAKRCGAP